MPHESKLSFCIEQFVKLVSTTPHCENSKSDAVTLINSHSLKIHVVNLKRFIVEPSHLHLIKVQLRLINHL